MKCSIVIPVFNKWFFTNLCLIALEKTFGGRRDCEVIIVDNASSDQTQAKLLGLRTPYRVIRNQENLGFAKGCNQGARAATGEYLVFLNNDTVPTDGWLDALIQVAEQDESIGIVGSKLLYPDDRIQHAGVVMSDERLPAHMYCLFPSDYPPANVDREYQAVTGACMLIRRELFESHGGFDEVYLNSYEDIDLCCRVRRQGRRVMYCAKSVLYHFESVSEGRSNFDDPNQCHFMSRWGEFIEPDERSLYLAEGFKDVPRVPGFTLWELHSEVADHRRLVAHLRRTNDLVLGVQKAVGRDPTACIVSNIDGSARVPTASSAAAWALLPDCLQSGCHTKVALVIANSNLIGVGERDRWFVASRWLDRSGSPVAPDERTALDFGVIEGKTATIVIGVVTPGQRGTYLLECALVNEEEFGSKANRTVLCSQKVEVVPRLSAEYSATIPDELVGGIWAKVVVVLKNLGSHTWLPNSPLMLSYHWYDASGTAPIVWDGLRTSISQRARYGESVAVTATVKVPELFGVYVLAFDLVLEGEAWFCNVGVPDYRTRVTVIPATTAGAGTGADVGRIADQTSQPVMESASGWKVDPQVFELLRAKEMRIAELGATLESMQSLKGLVQQREWQIEGLQARLEAAGRRLAAQENEIDRLQELLWAIERGKVMRLLNRLQLSSKRVRP